MVKLSRLSTVTHLESVIDRGGLALVERQLKSCLKIFVISRLSTIVVSTHLKFFIFRRFEMWRKTLAWILTRRWSEHRVKRIGRVSEIDGKNQDGNVRDGDQFHRRHLK